MAEHPQSGIDLVELARQSEYFEIRTDPILGRRPRTEPERFSGGVNLSAQARNRARLVDAARVYRMGRILLCAPWVFEWLLEQPGLDLVARRAQAARSAIDARIDRVVGGV